MDTSLDYLYGLKRFGMKLGLETMEKLLGYLDRPERAFRSIHIAGTNGKGSTAAFIASILRAAGFRVGLYTSPHLAKFNERISVDGVSISDKELAKYTNIIREKTSALQPTFFEFTTALAFLYFKQQRVDIAVVEVGLGGRLDATNVIEPILSIITNIEIEHTKHLGTSKLEIAKEKAAIIKPNSAVITAERDPEVLAYFEEVCKKQNSRLYQAPKSELVRERMTYQDFQASDETFRIHFPGKYQRDNACIALLSAHLLDRMGIKVHRAAIQLGLAQARWPGRIEVIKKQPLVVVDGAHNTAGMSALCEIVGKMPNRKVLVLGISEDKNISEMVRMIVPLFDKVIVTEGSFKPLKAEELALFVKKHTKNVEVVPSVKNAVDKALSITKDDELILITGSLYIIGEARTLIKS